MREPNQPSPGEDEATQGDVASRERSDLDIPGTSVAGGPTGTEDFDTFGETEAGASRAEEPPERGEAGLV